MLCVLRDFGLVYPWLLEHGSVHLIWQILTFFTWLGIPGSSCMLKSWVEPRDEASVSGLQKMCLHSRTHKHDMTVHMRAWTRDSFVHYASNAACSTCNSAMWQWSVENSILIWLCSHTVVLKHTHTCAPLKTYTLTHAERGKFVLPCHIVTTESPHNSVRKLGVMVTFYKWLPRGYSHVVTSVPV